MGFINVMSCNLHASGVQKPFLLSAFKNEGLQIHLEIDKT